jgi:hypothetical protein
VPIDEASDENGRHHERGGRRGDVRGMLPYRARKVTGHDLSKPCNAELTTIVDQLMRVPGEPLEAVDEMRRVKAGPCQGEVLADAAIQCRETGA